jgi:hypothetical protein
MVTCGENIPSLGSPGGEYSGSPIDQRNPNATPAPIYCDKQETTGIIGKWNVRKMNQCGKLENLKFVMNRI